MCVPLHKTNLKTLNPETFKMKINFEEIFKIHGEIVNDTPVQRLSNEQSMFIYLNCNARSWVKNSTGFEYLIVQRFFWYLLMPIYFKNEWRTQKNQKCLPPCNENINIFSAFFPFLSWPKSWKQRPIIYQSVFPLKNKNMGKNKQRTSK